MTTTASRAAGLACSSLLALYSAIPLTARAEVMAPITLPAPSAPLVAQSTELPTTFTTEKPKGGCRTICKILFGSLVLTALGVGGYYLSKVSSKQENSSSSSTTSSTTCRTYNGYNSTTVTCTSY